MNNNETILELIHKGRPVKIIIFGPSLPQSGFHGPPRPLGRPISF